MLFGFNLLSRLERLSTLLQIMKIKNTGTIFRILLLTFAAGLLVLMFALLFKSMLINPDIKIEMLYNILLASIFLFLLIAAFLVVRALQHWGYVNKPWVTLMAAYGLPFLVIVITYLWLQMEKAPLIEGRLINSFFQATWQPLLYFWQVMILVFSLRMLFPGTIPRQNFQWESVLVGVLAGLGAGLVNVFIISVLANLTANQTSLQTSLAPPSLLKWSSILLAISLAPYVVERFFRQILLDAWQSRFGNGKGFWLVAVLFAVVTFQPILMLSAFCSAILLGVLIQRYPFSTILVAHIVINAVLLIAGMQWVY